MRPSPPWCSEPICERRQGFHRSSARAQGCYTEDRVSDGSSAGHSLMCAFFGAWLSLARAPGSGPGGRWFESTRPDHFLGLGSGSTPTGSTRLGHARDVTITGIHRSHGGCSSAGSSARLWFWMSWVRIPSAAPKPDSVPPLASVHTRSITRSCAAGFARFIRAKYRNVYARRWLRRPLEPAQCQ
jgi:hypothetical protein